MACVIANLASAQSSGDFKSNGLGGGPWTEAATWLVYNGTAYEAASAAPASGNNIIIQIGDTIVYNNTGILSKLTIDSAALLQIPNGQTATLGSAIHVNGNLSVLGTFICNTKTVLGKGIFKLQTDSTLQIVSSRKINTIE